MKGKWGHWFKGRAGETQIEVDRRLLRDRISKLKNELTKIEKNRLLELKRELIVTRLLWLDIQMQENQLNEINVRCRCFN